MSTIENADQIFYIDHGQIVEHGTHQELLAKKGAYYRLHESQYAMIRTANGDQTQSAQPGDDAGQDNQVRQDSAVSAQ